MTAKAIQQLDGSMALRVQRNGRNRKLKPQQRRGAMVVMVAIMIVILIAMLVFAVDVAFMHLTRTQLRTATDSAARAATEALSRTQSVNQARQAAVNAAALNDVAGQPLQLAPGDVQFGNAGQDGSGRFVFTAGNQPFNAAQVVGRRTAESPGGEVPLLLGRLLNTNTFAPVQSALSVNLDRDLVLVVDRSGSMNRGLGPDEPPGFVPCQPPVAGSRWRELEVAVQIFIAALEETQQIESLGLVSYSSAGNACGIAFNDADIESNMSFNYGDASAAMQRIGNGPINGATNVTSGIDQAISELLANGRPFAEKTIVLMTDGRHNTGATPDTAAVLAAENNIVIHTITFSNEAEQATMQEVAAITGGQHFHAPDGRRLQEIFREVALTLPVLLAD